MELGSTRREVWWLTDHGRYHQCSVLKNRDSGFSWGIINVYGPVQLDLKPDFLRELMEVIMSMEVPLIVGGDFNLVREAAEKSTGNVNDSLVQLFNHFIDDVSLREMHRQGGSFTWTNKQEIPIMAVLDRVFVSNDWEGRFPLATTRSLTRVGSNHNPLLVETESEVLDLPYLELSLLGFPRKALWSGLLTNGLGEGNKIF